MAPTPTTTNWLSFSLSPMERLSSTNPHFLFAHTSSLPHYFLDNFYANGWTHPKTEVRLNNSNKVEQKEDQEQHHNNNMAHEPSLILKPPLVVPKLEDFFKTEIQDSSSLTQMYYFDNDQQYLKVIAGFKTFSNTNSGSEVKYDSGSVVKTRGGGALNYFVGGANSVESSRNELVVSGGGSSKGTLSLGAVAEDSDHDKTFSVAQDSHDKAIVVAANSDGSEKVVDTFDQRTSVYRGVTRHRWTSRNEAHLWDNSCRREGQARKRRQVYLGRYDKEEKAARAYDLAAPKYWGSTATTNFPVSNYTKELEDMKHVGKQEFIASLRRKSSGFPRGASMYRGVTRHHQQGRWQARIGRVTGNKDLYLEHLWLLSLNLCETPHGSDHPQAQDCTGPPPSRNRSRLAHSRSLWLPPL